MTELQVPEPYTSESYEADCARDYRRELAREILLSLLEGTDLPDPEVVSKAAWRMADMFLAAEGPDPQSSTSMAVVTFNNGWPSTYVPPKAGDKCTHCGGEWLSSSEGNGIWHNCHT